MTGPQSSGGVGRIPPANHLTGLVAEGRNFGAGRRVSNVYVLPVARQLHDDGDPRSAVSAPTHAADRVELPAPNTSRPNPTELSVCHEYASGWITLAAYVEIIGTADQRRAGYVLDRYLAGMR